MVKAHQPSYFDAIILDINMPRMDGVEVCKKILNYFNSSEEINSMAISPKRVIPRLQPILK